MSTDARAIEQIAELRCVLRGIDSPPERRRLGAVVRQLRFGLDVGIPKRRAAALLGISPQALERWISDGRIPVMRRPGSSRELVERDALIRLVGEVRALREEGVQRPVGRAVRQLEQRGELKPSVRLNQSARELRHEFVHSTPRQRLRNAVALSSTAHAMAERARTRQEASR